MKKKYQELTRKNLIKNMKKRERKKTLNRAKYIFTTVLLIFLLQGLLLWLIVVEEMSKTQKVSVFLFAFIIASLIIYKGGTMARSNKPSYRFTGDDIYHTYSECFDDSDDCDCDESCDCDD